jgi:hypothetical protein
LLPLKRKWQRRREREREREMQRYPWVTHPQLIARAKTTSEWVDNNLLLTKICRSKKHGPRFLARWFKYSHPMQQCMERVCVSVCFNVGIFLMYFSFDFSKNKMLLSKFTKSIQVRALAKSRGALRRALRIRSFFFSSSSSFTSK